MADEISNLIFLIIQKDIAKFVVCCSRDLRFKGNSKVMSSAAKSRLLQNIC